MLKSLLLSLCLLSFCVKLEGNCVEWEKYMKFKALDDI